VVEAGDEGGVDEDGVDEGGVDEGGVDEGGVDERWRWTRLAVSSVRSSSGLTAIAAAACLTTTKSGVTRGARRRHASFW
jgi:hypothetical protein